MKKAKRILCIIMALFIIAGAPLTSYMEAQAVEVIALPLLEDLLLSAGISFGIGEQLDFWNSSRKQSLDDYFSAAANGETVTLPDYGEVDFSDSGSISLFLDWCVNCNKFLMGNLSVVDPQHYTQYRNAALMWDKISYHNTGTSATNAMNDSISACYNDYNGSSEALAEDIQDCFTVIQGGGDFNDDDDNDEEKAARRQKFWKTFCAVTAAGLIGCGNTALPLSSLKEYGNSEFSEYDSVFGDAYFDGNYEMNADGRYVYSVKSSAIRSVPHTSPIEYVDASLYGELDGKVVAYHSGSLYLFVCLNGNGTALSRVSIPYVDNRLGSTSGIEDSTSLNFPLYPDESSALAALRNNDFSGAENLQSSYSDFKSNTNGAGAVVGGAFSNYIGSLRSLSDIANVIPGISDASNTYGGTSKALEAVADILKEAASIPGTNPEPDVDPDPGGATNYSGILGKILTAINNLPGNILNAFVGKFMTAEGLTNLINNLPVLFADAFKAVLDLALNPVISAINAVPAGMYLRLIELFPNSEAVGNAIIGFPDAVAQAVSAISVKVPEIKVPEIEIPEIKIPEITAPDVNVEVNPNITVQNDYIALGSVISDSVEGALTELLVPDQDLAFEKIDDMKQYFKFADDIEEIVGEFEKKVFGITPSPILKIPIGKPTSEKYKYGTGDYIIIDVSWYAQYKEFGDKIILAFAWVFFIWRIFVLMPGIISGGVGGFFETRDLWNEYSINRAYKNLDNLRRDYTSKD